MNIHVDAWKCAIVLLHVVQRSFTANTSAPQLHRKLRRSPAVTELQVHHPVVNAGLRVVQIFAREPCAAWHTPALKPMLHCEADIFPAIPGEEVSQEHDLRPARLDPAQRIGVLVQLLPCRKSGVRQVGHAQPVQAAEFFQPAPRHNGALLCIRRAAIFVFWVLAVENEWNAAQHRLADRHGKNGDVLGPADIAHSFQPIARDLPAHLLIHLHHDVVDTQIGDILQVAPAYCREMIGHGRDRERAQSVFERL